MSTPSERRRKPRENPVPAGEYLWVKLLNVAGLPNGVSAKVVDLSQVGLAVETDCELELNTVVTVDGPVGYRGSQHKVNARVVSCKTFGSAFRSGLNFEHQNGSAAAPSDTVPDHYELLQISPNADPDMVHRVYRLLAQRYHPDNGTSGDEEAFKALSDAYQVLSDPEKRAAYDISLHAYRQARWRIFDQRQAAVGKLAEKSRRRGILDLLYTKRFNEPEKPTLNLHEMEDLLGVPREHLEFSIWYLRENGLIKGTDNARFAVTVQGVDWAEEEEAEEHRASRLLPGAPAAEGT